MTEQEFSGRRVLVTGAGKGIGRATAVLLAGRGATVVALSRSAEDLAGLAAEIGCETAAVDIADAAATAKAVAGVVPVDLLVNCAGTTELQSFLDTSVETFDHIMAVNVRASMIVAQVVARSLIERGQPGAIVNVSSTASWLGVPDHTAYCASKGALDAMTAVMAVELGPKGIRVNAVNPTVTLTPMAIKAWSDPDKAGGMLKRIPMGRFVEPHEVAEAIAYLLSDRAAMINGITMPVDGGLMVA